MASFRFALGAAVMLGAASGAALAAGDLSKQTPIEGQGLTKIATSIFERS
jgi:hypothetical protein